MKASTKLRVDSDEVILPNKGTIQLNLDLEPAEGQYTFSAFN